MDSEAEQTKKRAQAAYLLDQIAEKQREKAEREREQQEREERERARDDFDPYARPAVTAADKARARVRGDLAAPSRPPPESAEARAARAFRPQALAGRDTLAPQLQMAGLSLQPGVQPGMQPGVQPGVPQQLGGMGDGQPPASVADRVA